MRRYLDYSGAKLSGFSIRRDGYDGVIRYIDAPNRLRTKHTDLNEYRDHLANGLTVYLVFQNTTQDPEGGYAAGVANAQRAKAGAEYLGYTGVVFFCNDKTTLNATAWHEYLSGAASVLGRDRVGAYGFRNAMDTANGLVPAFWQSGRQSELVSFANLYQFNNGRVYVDGLECDLNYVYADYSPNGGSGQVPVPIKSTDEDEDNMYRELLDPAASTRTYTIPWDGSKAVLNVIGTVVGEPVFLGKPLNWGPKGGTGGGNSTVAGVNPSRVEINQPGQYDIPQGTTRIVYSYSCKTPHWITVVSVA
jgi:hypothetical protein